jgi:hypothetical protein
MATLDEQLAAAREEAAKTNERLVTLDHQLTVAVEAQDFAEAERLKGLLPDARLAHMLAEGAAASFENALAQFAEADAERERQAAEAEHRRQAAEQRDAAAVVEREAMAEMQRHLADVDPSLAAVRETLRLALAAEARVTHARDEVHRARVTLGEVEPVARSFGMNHATVKIENNAVLRAIQQGRSSL